MGFTSEKAIFWLKNRQKSVLFGAIFASILYVSWLCLAKYDRFGYNAIDLAYFNQVFWNTVHGRPFTQSIHPHLSLGDHAELVILPLSIVYAAWQDPQLLLILQSVVLALCAWPIFLLARTRSKSPETDLAPLLLALAWLANPLLHNIALFEFHILPFAIFPLFFALLAYRRNQRRTFFVWTIIALLVREDVALVIAAISLLAWAEKRSRWWRVVPLAFGIAWFAGAMLLIRHFAPTGGYKFTIYYAWLMDALPNPLPVITHVATLANMEMALGFLMAFALLPLFDWRPLVLILGPLAQIMLGAPGGGSVIIDTHYSSLFIPGLALAAIDGYSALPARLERFRMPFTASELHALPAILVMLISAYSAIVLGSLPTSTTRALSAPPAIVAHAKEILMRIPANTPVAASYALLPHLSSREHVYSAHYLFLGVTQFAEAAYPTPNELAYVAFDDSDFGFYAAQFPATTWAAPHYAGGLARLANAAGKEIARSGTIGLYGREQTMFRVAAFDDWQRRSLPMTKVAAGATLILDGDRSTILSTKKR